MFSSGSSHIRQAIFKASRLPNLVRYKCIKPIFHDLESYLKYADLAQTKKDSTVFQGTLYELKTKETLERVINIQGLRHAGGAYDNGIDLIGNFDMIQYKTDQEPRKSISVLGKKVKPLILKKRTDLDVIVQCKCFSSKIAAKEIREQSGIINFNVRRADRNNTLMIMAAPSVLTAQGLAQLDTLDAPMIYCQISKMRQIGNDVYDSNAYDGGDLLNFYFNPYALALFEGTSFYDHLLSHRST